MAVEATATVKANVGAGQANGGVKKAAVETAQHSNNEPKDSVQLSQHDEEEVEQSPVNFANHIDGTEDGLQQPEEGIDQLEGQELEGYEGYDDVDGVKQGPDELGWEEMGGTEEEQPVDGSDWFEPSEPSPAEGAEAGEPAAPARRPYTAPNPDEFHPAGDESERTPEVVAAQNAAVEEALRTNQPVQFRNSEGQTVDVSISRTDNGYSYQMNGQTVPVTFASSYGEQEQHEMMAQLMDYQSQVPPAARNIIQHVDFQAPEQANERGQTRQACFSFDNQTMTFFGRQALTEGNFNHELGHGVGNMAGGGGGAYVPEDYDAAVSADNREISQYGRQTRDDSQSTWGGWLGSFFDAGPGHSDDFAETYAAYAEARESGPEAMNQFRSLYPNRARLMDRYFEPAPVDVYA